jgi:hypothetical protein
MAGKRGKPFEPGQSGNPGGRPRSTLSQTLKKVLAEDFPGKKFSNETALCRAMVAEAIRAPGGSRDFIWNKMEPPEPGAAGGAPGSGALVVQLVDFRAAK